MKGTCPYCQYKFDNSETIEGRTNVKDGDISFCIKCGKVGQFDKGTVIKCDEMMLPLKNIIEVSTIRESWEKVMEDEQEKSN